MTTNPIHLYRALLRECTYLPLPRCRSFMKSYVTESFRRWLPKYTVGRTNTGREIDFPKQVQLLHRGRKALSTLHRANEGHLGPLEKVLRLTYGRTGPRRHQLLNKFLAAPPPLKGVNEASCVDLSPSTTDGDGDGDNVTKYSRAWEPPLQMQALLASQAEQQHQFGRAGTNLKVKVRFSPPEKTTWGNPLPERRYKNLKHEWYLQNLKAVLPPLPEPEYREVYNLTTGASKFPALKPRRPRASVAPDVEQRQAAEKQSTLILSGPQPGPRAKDAVNGRPHKLRIRLLRRILARSVLKQTPLARIAQLEKVKRGIVFKWDDGHWQDQVSRNMPKESSQKQIDMLFG
ncbi:hypothetical protein A1O1_03784 [Capronia coronata CBS 617.96]|uniref:LYR motif-containing protein Cup1-like N-terminal domain-containing protein n=1 Tax=Capronia coronata CBS 617.96 TaxID=1182541 RepID=W9YLX0_9EURO|nr:uncharacterized protein A1O1_03784 [Capronia coronata CBS 617.96]EXJ90680.1 hypothetical protein A1O1_03784 [Capronia coronata CBS 617.96]